MKTYDLIVLGGGRASGLAITATEAGKNVALIEKDKLGGTCPNRGCVPSKLLIGFAETARHIRHAEDHFIDAQINSIDVQKIIRETNEWASKVDQRYASRHPDGLDLYRGHGAFIDDHIIEVNGEQLTAKDIVIATGARPRPAPIDIAGVMTSDDLFPLKGDVPQSISIVGGGFIAVELANFFAAVGVDTTLLARGDRLLPAEDSDISTLFTEQFSQMVDTRLNCEIETVSHDGDQYTLQLNDGSSHQSEALLYAIGRILNTDNIGLENTAIELHKNGSIVRNNQLETGVPGVYAVGDVGAEYQLQHLASYEVHYLRQRLLKGDDTPIHYGAIPHAVFSHPEIASVGLTEQQAQASDRNYTCVTQNWLASARAMSTRLEYPRTKLIVDTDSYEVIGCHLIGPEASTMIHQIMMLMQLNNDIRELPKMVHIHPALPEALLSAAVEVIKKINA